MQTPSLIWAPCIYDLDLNLDFPNLSPNSDDIKWTDLISTSFFMKAS